MVGDPPACLWEACFEDIEEFARDVCECGGLAGEVGDGASAVDRVEAALGVVVGGGAFGGVRLWRGGDLGTAVEDACVVDPPDEWVRAGLVCDGLVLGGLV